MKEILTIVRQLGREAGVPHVLATLVSVEGSSYRRVGARLLAGSDGLRIGTISGGCLESDVMERARAVLDNGKPQVALYDTTDENDLVWGVGLGCTGVVKIFLERLPAMPAWADTVRRNLVARKETSLAVVWESADPALIGTHDADALAGRLKGKASVFNDHILPPPRLLVFGAGDDAQPLSKLAKELGWQVEVYDARAAYATSQRFPVADKIVISPEEDAASVPIDQWTIAVVMTHRYKEDVALARALLPRPLAYIGMLGPKKRTERILGELSATGFTVTDDMRARLRAPVGLDIGGDTPETVALSMLAEIQATFSGRDARPLRERVRPIHA